MKPSHQQTSIKDLASLPPPFGGGLIEAIRPMRGIGAGADLPPPFGGGLIEAEHLVGRAVTAMTSFRPRLGAASLKRLGMGLLSLSHGPSAPVWGRPH